jgi:hypothetical protein
MDGSRGGGVRNGMEERGIEGWAEGRGMRNGRKESR